MNPLNLIPAPYRIGAILLVVAVLVGIFGIQQFRLENALKDLKTEQAGRAAENLAAEGAADKAKGEIATLKADHKTKETEKDDAFKSEKTALQTQLAARAAANSSLLNKLAASTSRGSGQDPTGPAACQRNADRLEALGLVAGKGVSLLEEGRGLLQQRALEVKRLRDQIDLDRAACSR